MLSKVRPKSRLCWRQMPSVARRPARKPHGKKATDPTGMDPFTCVLPSSLNKGSCCQIVLLHFFCCDLQRSDDRSHDSRSIRHSDDRPPRSLSSAYACIREASQHEDDLVRIITSFLCPPLSCKVVYFSFPPFFARLLFSFSFSHSPFRCRVDVHLCELRSRVTLPTVSCFVGGLILK